MKATDLMVGDWLHIHYKNKYEGEVHMNFRVMQIRDDFGDMCVWSEFGNMGAIQPKYGTSNIEPIPLTPEILEENANGGWCNYQSEPKGRSIYHIGEVAVYVEWKRIVPSPYIEIHGLGDTFFKGYIDYIHELQHALRLCGIEKEIEL